MAKIFRYSTGAVENEISQQQGPVATILIAKALNNSCLHDARVRIKLFELNGTKTLVRNELLTLAPQSSNQVVFNVDLIAQYELQFLTDSKFVLVSAFSKASNLQLVAAQRLVHQEFNKKIIKTR